MTALFHPCPLSHPPASAFECYCAHTYHSTTSFQLGVSRTLSLLRRFYWLIGKKLSTRWWLRCCL